MKRILIIDDEQDMLDILRYCLEAEGYEIYTASDGVEGFVKIKDCNPDLIILDVMMPNLDGWSLLNLFKRDRQSMPIVVLSGARELRKTIKKEMDVDFFVKPFQTFDVVNKINDLVHGS